VVAPEGTGNPEQEGRVLIEITDTRNVPGHRDAGAKAWHRFGVGCLECEAHALRWLSLGEVEQLHRGGTIDDLWFHAYMWLFSKGPVFCDYGDWTPRDEATWARVGMLQDAWGLPRRRFPIGPRRYGRETCAGSLESASFSRAINGTRYVFAYRRIIIGRVYVSITVSHGETGEVLHAWGAPFEKQGPAAAPTSDPGGQA
jgi:hypothetical protein